MNVISILIQSFFMSILLLPTVAVAGEPHRIVVLGDSLSAGYGLEAKEAFPVRLEQALRAAGHKVTVINAGVTGDTSAGGLARLDWALADRPQIVIIELGADSKKSSCDHWPLKGRRDRCATDRHARTAQSRF
jgi:acyl-CoA thioesterase-1